MRKADLARNHDDFDVSVKRYREFMKKIIAARRVVATEQEKRDVAESTILRLCANWERFIDSHLVDCINCDASRMNEYLGVALKPHPDRATCQAILIGGRYLDLKSFSSLKKFSKQVLPDASNPFLVVTKTERDRIDEVYIIRNYLSHYSDKAKRALRAVYKKKYSRKKFCEPGYFLLGHKAKWLWAYFDAFENASVKMKKWCCT